MGNIHNVLISKKYHITPSVYSLSSIKVTIWQIVGETESFKVNVDLNVLSQCSFIYGLLSTSRLFCTCKLCWVLEQHFVTAVSYICNLHVLVATTAEPEHISVIIHPEFAERQKEWVKVFNSWPNFVFWWINQKSKNLALINHAYVYKFALRHVLQVWKINFPWIIRELLCNSRQFTDVITHKKK